MFNGYDKKTFWRSLQGFVIMSVLMKLTGGAGFAVVAGLSVIAMLVGRTKLVLFCLILANCALMGNSWFFPKDFIFGVAHRGMLVVLGACLAAKVFGGRSYKVLTPFMWILPFIIYMIVPSLNGWAPMVSMLKIFLFIMVYMAYMGSAKMALAVRGDASGHFRAMIVAAIAFFIFGSVLIMPFPGISYMGADELLNDSAFMADLEAGRAVSLFKGMTWHSQTLGPLMSVFCVFMVGDMLFNIKRMDKLYAVMILICPFLIYKTSSRTAMAVLICGVAAIVLLFMNSHSIKRTWKAKIMNIAFFASAFMVLSVIIVPGIREGIVRYALKYNKEESVKFSAEEMISTRQGLMDEAIYNWRKKPWIGNGFQVSAKMQYERREGLKDYLTAPIEKGVWVTAILEEGGIVGLILFCAFWIPAFFSLWAGRFYATAAMLLSFIIMNMAEFIILSMSGGGGFLWSIVFILAILDGKREMDESWQVAPMVGYWR